MMEKYKVVYDGARTRIVETPAGEWPRWNMARVAVIEHVEEIQAEAQAALDTLRRSGNYYEYTRRRAAAGAEQVSHDVHLVPSEDAEDSFKLTGPTCRC